MSPGLSSGFARVAEGGRGADDGDRASNRAGRRAALTVFVFGLLVIVLWAWQPRGLELWLKALHIVAVISWMAGLLYLPRLFIYHSQSAVGSAESETFKTMERRLLAVIMRPAMIATWVLGLYLAYASFGFSGGWLWAKIALVVGLSAVHGHFAGAARALAADERRRSTRYWRMMNEVPTVLMVAIVILVVVKPF